MKPFFKLVYYISLAYIISCIGLSILMKILPIEFSNDTYSEDFDSIFFIGIPIAILLTLSRIGFKVELSKTQIKSAIVKTILLAVTCFVLFLFYNIVTFGSSMCTWTSGETLYRNSTNTSQKIIKRYFGCGATDSSPSTVGVFKVQQITRLFIYVTKVDTTKLDRHEWINVKK